MCTIAPHNLYSLHLSTLLTLQTFKRKKVPTWCVLTWSGNCHKETRQQNTTGCCEGDGYYRHLEYYHAFHILLFASLSTLIIKPINVLNVIIKKFVQFCYVGSSIFQTGASFWGDTIDLILFQKTLLYCESNFCKWGQK